MDDPSRQLYPGAGLVSPGANDDHTEGAPIPPRKRKRRVISCAECHRRKQKCDRGLPCKACIDRKMEASCHYETVAMSRERHHTRIIEAATYGRALQEGGTIQVKTAGFGYAQTTANTLGFLHKIDGGRLATPGGSNIEAGNETGGASLASMVSESPDPGAVARKQSPTGSKTDLDQNRQQRYGQTSSASPSSSTPQPADAYTALDQQRRLQRPHAAGDPYGMGERYRALVRELPSRANIDHLAGLYFRDFNWNYYAIDEDVFVKQLGDWMDIALSPFGAPQSPVQMSPDLRAFPALLLNVIAMGLLMLDTNKKEDMDLFEAIKRPNCETFEDLALEYSETGLLILSLLGKRQMSYTTVLAGFARSAFLKYAALVTEAWHAIGTAIRDAQEVGLHRSDMDPKPWAQTAEAVLENQWEIQRRRRLWMTLVSWDIQMGIILGRPVTVDLSAHLAMPIDCILPKTYAERSTMAVQPRSEHDPPTPLSRVVWAYDAIKPLRRILELEKEGPCPRNFARVDEIHEELVDIESRTPPFFRLENPDTRFDNLPGCDWLRSVRATMPQIPIFNFMALHRQYIFTRPKSRTEALKACIRMLQVQRVHFASLRPQQYKTFSLFFGTFDSLVLLATIYILFPKEHHDLLPEAIQHYRWSTERFEIMKEHYGLARSALSVLHANYARMRKALGDSFVESEPGTAPAEPLTLGQIDPSLKGEKCSMATGSNTGNTPGEQSHASGLSSAGSDVFSSSAATGQGDTPTTETHRHGSASAGGPSPSQQPAATSLPTQPQDLPKDQADSTANGLAGAGFTMPNTFDWANMSTGDMSYNGLPSSDMNDPNAAARAAVHAAQDATAAEQGIDGTMDDFLGAWQYEGDFSSFSVWGLLNQYNP